MASKDDAMAAAVRDIVNLFGQTSAWDSSPALRTAARGAVLVAALVLLLFAISPSSLGLVGVMGYLAIVAVFVYRWYVAYQYDSRQRKIALVSTAAGVWTAVILALFLLVTVIRFVFGSVAGFVGEIL
jgi:hypothetical protein